MINCSCVEYKDDSYVIPRSSSVIAKRIPAAKPGKGKAAMYLGGTGPAASRDGKDKKPGAMAGANTWSRPGSGPMSKRFDKAEPPPKARSSVRLAP